MTPADFPDRLASMLAPLMLRPWRSPRLTGQENHRKFKSDYHHICTPMKPINTQKCKLWFSSDPSLELHLRFLPVRFI